MGRAGAVVSRAIGPPVGSLHAAQAILLPGSSRGVYCDQRKAREGKPGKGAVGGVLPRYQAWGEGEIDKQPMRRRCKPMNGEIEEREKKKAKKLID